MSAHKLDGYQKLIDSFVATFESFDEMIAYNTDPTALALIVGEPDQYGYRKWRAKKTPTDLGQLEPIYSSLPARFPPAFEQLVLSYRWTEVDLGRYRLVANPPGPDFSGLFEQISRDDFMWKHLLRAGYIRFGKGPDMDYDPVCFDIKSRRKNGEYKVVKLDHEEILCNERIEIVAELADGFEELMIETINRAENL